MVRATLTPLVGIVALAACETPGVRVLRPDPETSPPTTNAIHVALEDTALAQALGWEGGVPDAAVILQRLIDPFQPETLYTDATGRVTPGGQVPGWYLVAGYRVLSADETVVTSGVVRAFGDGLKLELPRESIELRLRADAPGSLVVSEFYVGGSTLEIRYGSFDQFFEVYNNSDTTVFVDGMLLGRAYSMVGSNDPCEEHAAVRGDSLGLWARAFHQFPGTGTDHPVVPGQVITIAVDAVDHSVVHASLPDLSNADFEFEGTADTDNPDVPNMPELSLLRDLRGHGMITIPNAAHFLALPVTVSNLPRRLVDGTEYVRIPTERLVDVFQTHWLSDSSAPPSVLAQYCAWVNPRFDRLETPWYRLGNDNQTSNHRRVLRRDTSGRLVLHDVNASFVDWLLAPYSPGRIEH